MAKYTERNTSRPEISFVPLKRNIVWSPNQVPGLLCYLGDRIIGSYHASGMSIVSWVAGDLDYTIPWCDESLWRERCQELEHSRYIVWRIVRDHVIVKWDDDGRTLDILLNICHEPRYYQDSGDLYAKLSDIPYLEYISCGVGPLG